MAQGIRGIHRSCFGTQNRNDNRNGNRNSVGSRGVYCSCLGTRNRNGVRSYCTCLSTRNRNGVRSYCTCLSTQNRNGTAGRIWREIVKDSRNFSNLPAGITPFVSKLLKLPWREPSGFRNVTVFTISKKSLLKNVSGRKYKKYVEHCKGKVFVCGQYMGAIDFYTVLTYNQFKIINNNCKQYFCIFHVIKIQKYS